MEPPGRVSAGTCGEFWKISPTKWHLGWILKIPQKLARQRERGSESQTYKWNWATNQRYTREACKLEWAMAKGQWERRAGSCTQGPAPEFAWAAVAPLSQQVSLGVSCPKAQGAFLCIEEHQHLAQGWGSRMFLLLLRLWNLYPCFSLCFGLIPCNLKKTFKMS